MHDHRHARALPAGLAVAALALPAAADGSTPTSAGWHGRAIRAPHARLAADAIPRRPPGWSAGDVARGTGYARPGGSQRVRELQRRLRRRGYRPGPADGCFGVRTLEKVIHDALPERGRASARPGLAHALDEIGAGRARGLVVARLRDLTDSVTELGPLLRWFADGDAFVIALDYELDTSSAPGGFAAGALEAISEWERDRVEARTRAGLDAARRGAAVRDASEAVTSAQREAVELSARIAAMRDEGMSLQAIADELNAKGVPTLRGGSRWRPSSVQAATGYKRPSAKRGAREVDDG
jgi:DNA invertase Pin-like site-specific DNA recombinase